MIVVLLRDRRSSPPRFDGIRRAFGKIGVPMAPLQAVLDKVRTEPPNILAALQAVQSEYGFVDVAQVPLIAHALGVTDSDVHGVLSFYHDLRTTAPGKRHIRFCLGDSCVAMKAEKSLDALQKSLKCGLGETTRDGKFTLDKIYCLGNCALSPAMMVNGEVYGRLTPKTVTGLAKGARP
jgi:NADH:ubiquinone oxidoreductase subunit E